MNNKVLIIIGCLLIVVLAGLNIFQYLIKDKKVEQINYSYDCTKASEVNSGSAPGIDHIIMTYDELGVLLSSKYISEYTYENKEKYDGAVKFYKQYGKNEYEYNDKNLKIKVINKDDNLNKTDSEGNKIDNWIKYFINNYEKQGYTCTKK